MGSEMCIRDSPRDAALRVDVALPADEDAAAAQLDEFASAADEADSDMDE